MNIKINKQSVYAIGTVMGNFSNQVAGETSNTRNKLMALASEFIDKSYEGYSTEYMAELGKIYEECYALQQISKAFIEYSKKLPDN